MNKVETFEMGETPIESKEKQLTEEEAEKIKEIYKPIPFSAEQVEALKQFCEFNERVKEAAAKELKQSVLPVELQAVLLAGFTHSSEDFSDLEQYLAYPPEIQEVGVCEAAKAEAAQLIMGALLMELRAEKE